MTATGDTSPVTSGSTYRLRVEKARIGDITAHGIVEWWKVTVKGAELAHFRTWVHAYRWARETQSRRISGASHG